MYKKTQPLMRNLIMMTLLLLSNQLGAQKGSLTGYIKDGETQAPLSGASVLIQPALKGENTDPFGKFQIPDLLPGRYELIASHIGYKPELISVEITGNQVSTVWITMKKASLDLAEIKVNSKKNSPLNLFSSVDIMLRPVNTSQDLLRMVPGLFIAQHAGGGKAEQIFLRGYDIDHGTDIQITVDGLPVNMVSHAHGQGYADLHFLIPESVEKINFDKGPYFTPAGNQATAGRVEFYTHEFLNQNQIKTEIGRFNTQRAVTMLKLINKESGHTRQQFYVASEYSKTNSYFESSQDFHRFNLMGKYNAWLNPQTQLTLTGSTFSSRWNASGQIPDRAVQSGLISRFGAIDDSEGGFTGRSNLGIRFSKQGKRNWQVNTGAYYTRYHFNLFSNFTFFLNDSINGDQIQQQEKRNLFGMSTVVSKTWKYGNKKTTADWGGGFRWDNIADITLSQSLKRMHLANWQQGDIREINSFLYWNQTLELNHKFTVNGGVRFDAFHFAYRNRLTGEKNFRNQQRKVLSPKLNFTYTASAVLQLYFNNGIGFHSNDTRVILNNEATEIVPKVFGTDLGIVIKPNKKLLIKTALWHLYSQQEFVYVGDEGVVEPSGKTRRFGFDFSVRYQFNKWLYGDFDLNLTRARSIELPKGENFVPLAAGLTSLGGLTAKMNNGFSGLIRYRFMANRPANEFNTIKARGYLITDMKGAYLFKNKLEIAVSAENIFNVEWREAQFETLSRLQSEPEPVSEIHYTPGILRFVKASVTLHF
jgi:outer membrane cobalamin receptor